jgi:hypothetical protein
MQNTISLGDPLYLPVRGELYRDLEGRYLRVEAVIHNTVLDGFFIVRLGIGTTEECKDDFAATADFAWRATVRRLLTSCG